MTFRDLDIDITCIPENTSVIVASVSHKDICTEDFVEFARELKESLSSYTGKQVFVVDKDVQADILFGEMAVERLKEIKSFIDLAIAKAEALQHEG